MIGLAEKKYSGCYPLGQEDNLIFVGERRSIVRPFDLVARGEGKIITKQEAIEYMRQLRQQGYLTDQDNDVGISINYQLFSRLMRYNLVNELDLCN